MRIFLRDDVLLKCVKERDLSFLEKAAFFAHDLKFRRKKKERRPRRRRRNRRARQRVRGEVQKVRAEYPLKHRRVQLEIFDDTEDKNNNGLVRGRRRRRRRGRSCFATRSEIRAGFERNGSGFRICGGRRADERGNEF